MAKKKKKDEKFVCPVGELFLGIDRILGKESDFVKHMVQSRIEFLKAIRTLLDERIESLEKKRPAKSGKKMTKIKVE